MRGTEVRKGRNRKWRKGKEEGEREVRVLRTIKFQSPYFLSSISDHMYINANFCRDILM